MTECRRIKVTCAIVEEEGLVLAARRGSKMSLPLKWEFPGGKVDEGETLEECLVRELMEELGMEVSVKQPLSPSSHSYPDAEITLYPFICSRRTGEICLLEHAEVLWLTPERLRELDWAEADIPVLEEYLGRFRNLSQKDL